MLDIKKEIVLLEKMKRASSGIGTDEQAVHDMADAISELLGKDTLTIFDFFNAALAFEKIAEYEKAIYYYGTCAELLPESSLRHALSGMINRVKSKMDPENPEYYDSAISDFEAAERTEKVPWRIDKWKLAVEEMKRQQILQWRER